MQKILHLLIQLSTHLCNICWATYFVPGTFLGIEITELRTDQKVGGGGGAEGAGAGRSLYLSRSGNYWTFI